MLKKEVLAVRPEKKEKKPSSPHLATECDKIGEIAVQYGFTPVKPPHISPDDISKAKQFKEFDYYNEAEEKIALTRWFESHLQGQSQPAMIHFKKPLPGSSYKKKPTEEMYGFEIMGSGRTTCEALLIKVALASLSDLGYKELFVDVNTIGDRESIAKFERDLGFHFRRHGHTIPAKMRTDFKKNPYSVFLDTTADTEEFRAGSPQPVGCLSEIARMHFKEVLEYLEAFEVPYKIKNGALSNKLYATHTVFEIRAMDKKNADDGTLLAYGYRYNYLGRKVGLKKDVPCVGLTIIVKKHPDLSKKLPVKNMKKPKYYLVQLGNTAKLKALNVVEHLRKHKIPVYHSLTKDKITGQLSGAEYMHATHVLIIGQKEAIENTVVVRNVNTREQETVAVSELCDFLKKMEKSK